MRLIYSPPQNGIINMATDQAIMEAVGDRRSEPTLRFYSWQPACLSLGYTQRARDVDFARVQRMGWDVVRRPTGGRAILHTDELTYSVSLPQDHELARGDILASYQRLSVALQHGLEKFGLHSQQAPRKKGGANSPVCFETPSAYEITADARKLIGSAQVRRQGAVLQHGTLPLHGDIARICDALVYTDEFERDEARDIVRQRATTVENVIGQRIDWQRAAEMMAEAFAETFSIDLIEDGLSPEESLRMEQLRTEVYGSEAWTLKR
jgi:lipoate-protein ligase A